MIDKEKLKRAQEWADQASEMAKYDPTLPERAKAAAEVIKSLPDTETAFDPEHSYRDRIGNEWSHVVQAWRCYSTKSGKLLASHPSPPDKYGPYTRIEDTNE